MTKVKVGQVWQHKRDTTWFIEIIGVDGDKLDYRLFDGFTEQTGKWNCSDLPEFYTNLPLYNSPLYKAMNEQENGEE